MTPELLDLLVCPESRQPLVYLPPGVAGEGEYLLCPASRLRYRVDGGLPVMLVDEAERLPVAEVERLVGLARAGGARVPAPVGQGG